VTSQPQGLATPELARLVRAEVEAARFPFPAAASAEAAERRDRLARDLDQAAPKALARAGVPPVVELVGGTGVGKSTLANSLAGLPLSRVGALRPTTRRPQLLANPLTAALLGDHPTLTAAEPCFEAAQQIPWAILDCADPFARGNDPAAAQPEVPVAARLVVTSALRYGDALLWDLLRSLNDKSVPALLVVNRLPSGLWEAIRPDVARRLKRFELGFIETVGVVSSPGQLAVLPPESVAPVKQWLEEVLPPAELAPEASSAISGLGRLAAAARLAAQDQLVHAQAVALLREATDRRSARPRPPLQLTPPPQLAQPIQERWRSLNAPGGPLADVASAGPSSTERRERWGGALGELAGPLDDAVADLAFKAAHQAQEALAEVWRGPGVPAGSRELLRQASLEEPTVEPPTSGQAWARGITAALSHRDAPAARRAAEALTQAGLAALIQAAVLTADSVAAGGPAGPSASVASPVDLLVQLVGSEAETLVGVGRQTLEAELAGAAAKVSAAFEAALARVDVPPSAALAWAADKLAAAAARLASPTPGGVADLATSGLAG
jgi:energy-coupling factor transporter ATP-binding protein EcfA2